MSDKNAAPSAPESDEFRRSALARWRAAMKPVDPSWGQRFNAETKFLRDQAQPTDQPQVRK